MGGLSSRPLVSGPAQNDEVNQGASFPWLIKVSKTALSRLIGAASAFSPAPSWYPGIRTPRLFRRSTCAARRLLKSWSSRSGESAITVNPVPGLWPPDLKSGASSDQDEPGTPAASTSTINAMFAPLCPPKARSAPPNALPGSVVASPCSSIAHPAGIARPSEAAWTILTNAVALEAWSITNGVLDPAIGAPNAVDWCNRPAFPRLRRPSRAVQFCSSNAWDRAKRVLTGVEAA
jgi:hypothetical protein